MKISQLYITDYKASFAEKEANRLNQIRKIVSIYKPTSMKKAFLFFLSLIIMIPLIVYAWWPGAEDIR